MLQATQFVELFVSTSAEYSPYIGNQVLPEGPSPFTNNTPSSNGLLNVWVIIGICIGGIVLIIILTVLVAKLCDKGGSEADASAVVYASSPRINSTNSEQQFLINSKYSETDTNQDD